MTITPYTSLVTSQHKTKPKFIAWLSAPLKLIDDGIKVANNITASFDIDVAVGTQLDILGTIIARSRTLNFQPLSGPPVLDDTNYRLALKAKIAQNQWDGTLPQIYDIWNSILPDVGLVVIDNQDMTMSALIDGVPSSIMTEMIAAGFIIPKPMGVKVTVMDLTIISESNYIAMMVSEFEQTTINLP